MNQSLKIAFLVGLAAILAFAEPGGNRILVISESANLRSTHSHFLGALEKRGYKLSLHTEEDTIQFRTYGEWNFDHLVLFTPSITELPTGLTVKTILEFIDEGHNALIVAGTEIGKPLVDIASDCGVEFDEEGTFVIDHFNYNASDAAGQHNVLNVDAATIPDAKVIFPTKVQAPLLYRGIGQDIEEDSALLFCLLHGSETAYSAAADAKIDEPHVLGKKICLVSALQARNNARVIFSGSLEFFSDAYFTSAVQRHTADGSAKRYAKSGNEEFSNQVVQWLLQERGILRASNVKHHLAGQTETPFTYTIKDDIEYSVDIEQWNGETKKWEPFLADDVQLEFRMLDPYVRTKMTHNKSGRYTTSFKLPDVYGVFTFKIEYVRRGYGFLSSITRTPVRPFRHNEYERFIGSAYPYYASAFSMMGGLFLFSWFFLYHRETTKV